MNIKKIRYAMGYSQQELANNLGVSRPYIVKIEKEGADITRVQDKIEVLIREKKLFHLLETDNSDKFQKMLIQLDVMYDKIRRMICEAM